MARCGQWMIAAICAINTHAHRWHVGAIACYRHREPNQSPFAPRNTTEQARVSFEYPPSPDSDPDSARAACVEVIGPRSAKASQSLGQSRRRGAFAVWWIYADTNGLDWSLNRPTSSASIIASVRQRPWGQLCRCRYRSRCCQPPTRRA